MPEIGIKDIRRYLNQQTKEALAEEIVSLVKTFPDVKDYYHTRLFPAEHAEVLSKYKKIIQYEFFPPRGFGKLQLSTIRKAISAYKKVSSGAEGTIELLLYFVGQGAKFIDEYGDIKESFYDSMESAYQEACQLVISTGGEEAWEDRFEEVVKRTNDTGYGFGDSIREMFHNSFRKKE